MIEISGDYGSGGGQIIRTSIAMSALTGKECHIVNLRAKRKTPGLRPQHLTGVKAVAELCDAGIKGAEIGSQELYFYPGKIKSGKFNFDIGTAGSITLVLQALMPAAIHSQGTLEFKIKGGTNVPLAPSAEYFQHIFCDYLRKMGIEIYSETLKHGFYPKGGGEIYVRIEPCKKLNPLYLTEKEELKKIDCWSIASEFLRNKKVAERQIEGFEKELKEKISKKNIIYTETLSPGTAIHAHAYYENCKLGSDYLGERGVPAETIGKKCAEMLKKEMSAGGCVDTHALDQLLPFMALAGSGKILANEITEHARTNAYIIEQFLPVKFEFEGNMVSVFRR